MNVSIYSVTTGYQVYAESAEHGKVNCGIFPDMEAVIVFLQTAEKNAAERKN